MNIFAILLIILFICAILCGTPLFAIVGGAAMILFHFVAEESIAIISGEIVRLADAPGITAIPLFIYAGFIFAGSKTSERLIRVSDASLGWMPGGMGVVTVLVCTVFTAMTGGSGITIIACGGLLLPALIKNNYGDDFSLGFVTSSSASGVLFAPSLPIIVYGMIAKVDITQLFIASAVPGLLIVLVLCAYAIIFGIRAKVPTTQFSWRHLKESIWEVKWIIPLPFVVIGGIYGGIITVSEAAAVAVVYALITECLIYREISFTHLIQISIDSMMMVGALLLVVGMALGLTNFLVDREIPQIVMELITDNISNKFIFLLILNVFLLIVGCIMDIFSAIVVVVPLIAPVAEEFGIDPVHLGVIFLANLQIGYITPPIGMNLFIASLRFNAPVLQLYRVVIPALILFLLCLIVISYWPQFSLFLLEISGQRPPLLSI